MADQSRIEDLRRRIRRDPSSIAFAQLAEEQRRIGQLAEAVETCREGLARHPGYQSARVTLGRALTALGRFNEASSELRAVLAARPNSFEARRALADALRWQGKLDEAYTHYRAALLLAPNDPVLDRIVTELTPNGGPDQPVVSEQAVIGDRTIVIDKAPATLEPAVTVPAAAEAPVANHHAVPSPPPALTPVVVLDPAHRRAEATLAALEAWMEAIRVTRAQQHA